MTIGTNDWKILHLSVQKRSKMHGSFLHLPIEIIDLIAHTVHPTDYFALRLACKAFRDKFEKHFAQKWFENLDTDLTSKSLSRLQRISQAEHLREHPQILNIIYKDDGSGQINLGRGFSWKRQPSGRLDGSVDQPCVQELQDILLNRLTNCRSFRVLGTGGIEDLYEGDRIWPSDAIAIVLDMIAETGFPVRSFWTDFNGNGIDTRRIDMEVYRYQRFQDGWADIQELRLENSPMLDSYSYPLMLGLLSLAPRLKSLSLQLQYHRCREFLEDYIGSGHELRSLEKLRLTYWVGTEELLFRFLSSSSNVIRELHLEWVTIDSDGSSWSQVLPSLKHNFPSLGKIYIQRARKRTRDGSGRTVLVTFPSLSKLPLSQPESGSTLAWERRSFHSFRFKPSSDASRLDELQETIELCHKRYEGEQRVMGVGYQGTHMSEALERITKSIEYMP